MEEINLSSKPEQISKSAKLICEKIFNGNVKKKIAVIGKNQFTNSLKETFNRTESYQLSKPNSDFLKVDRKKNLMKKLYKYYVITMLLLLEKNLRN